MGHDTGCLGQWTCGAACGPRRPGRPPYRGPPPLSPASLPPFLLPAPSCARPLLGRAGGLCRYGPAVWGPICPRLEAGMPASLEVEGGASGPLRGSSTAPCTYHRALRAGKVQGRCVLWYLRHITSTAQITRRVFDASKDKRAAQKEGRWVRWVRWVLWVLVAGSWVFLGASARKEGRWVQRPDFHRPRRRPVLKKPRRETMCGPLFRPNLP